MKKTLLLAVCSVLSMFAMATTYTSINDGNWNNTTTVWSTNGATPCNCAPSNTITTDTVVVQNYITGTAHIKLNNPAALLSISSGGVLAATAYKLDVAKGKVISNGTLQVLELNIGTAGDVTILSSILNVQSRILVDGHFTSTFSNVYIAMGNITISNTGSFIMDNNTKVYFITGNFENSGYVSLCGGCCIHLTAGNVENLASGTMTGSGSVLTDAGNIKNLGTWSLTLKWCSIGADFGMPSAENCTSATANCQFAPLPTELVSFDVLPEFGSNVVSWFTQSERNGDYYLLERSKTGDSWETLTKLDISSVGLASTHYVFVDDQPIAGISYYKLTLISTDGTVIFEAVLGVDTENTDNITIFPNPTTDHITVRFTKPLPWVKITITDATGMTKGVFDGKDVEQETIHLPYPCGLYFISIQSDGIDRVMKVIKK